MVTSRTSRPTGTPGLLNVFPTALLIAAACWLLSSTAALAQETAAAD